jgi:hypothetical protein
MRPLRIVQGGIKNGDKILVEQLAANGESAETSVAPKNSRPGDDVVIYIAGFGFFATATVVSEAQPRDDWPGRYGVALACFKLIEPAISLAAVRRHIPGLAWARYPRSITTPTLGIAEQVRELIRYRRKTGLPDLDDEALEEANIDELRKVAVMSSRVSAPTRSAKAVYRARSVAIRLYVLRRADGYCEYCEYEAPFYRLDGTPYLEPHHTTRLADGGPDHPSHVIALCPNCHCRAHHAHDATEFNSELKALLRKLESR